MHRKIPRSAKSPSAEQQDTHLIWQGDDGILFGDIGAVEVFAAGGQDGAVGSEAPVLHHHSDVA